MTFVLTIIVIAIAMLTLPIGNLYKEIQQKKSAGTVLATYPAYWAFALPLVKDKQRSAHADMSVIQ